MLKEIWLRRDLIFQLALKDLRIRYHGSVFGFTWMALSPFAAVAIFYLVFAVILKVRIDEVPFVLYLMSAVFPWAFFQDAVSASVTSLVDNRNLIREASFPHYFIPISIVLSKAVIFLPSLLIVLVASFLILKGLPVFVLFLPAVLILHISIILGLALILSIIYVKFRDIKYIVDSLMLLIIYLTPAFYSLGLIKASFSAGFLKLYISNPFVGMVNMYRVVILKDFYKVIVRDAGIFSLIVIPVLFALSGLLIGSYLYKRNKNIINDYLSY